ncbi:hypothetical protein BT96DRAFT_1000711 [Gymnopus androsaceus JB14]|uniref:Uncharacterized protein n=1 Tax=Gymnopus androsaceus JB14 TaxID=1447944 RepID=A0A6A4H4N8_9AGAR|nr:hypothetical protein BT96DRAFT_1000711 [Gymnopus androsaceus JB14]
MPAIHSREISVSPWQNRWFCYIAHLLITDTRSRSQCDDISYDFFVCLTEVHGERVVANSWQHPRLLLISLDLIYLCILGTIDTNSDPVAEVEPGWTKKARERFSLDRWRKNLDFASQSEPAGKLVILAQHPRSREMDLLQLNDQESLGFDLAGLSGGGFGIGL